MSFLLIEISSEFIQFWGCPDKGTPELILIQGEERLPPFLYSQGGDIKINNYARERYRKNDPNAFGNFALNPERKVDFKGESREIVQLFIYALESILANSDQPGLSNSFNDKDLIIRFWLSPEIREYGESFINAFKKDNFENVGFFKQNNVIIDLFSVDQHSIVLSGVNGDLHVDLIDKKGAFLTQPCTITGAGADPRVHVLADLIFDDIQSEDPYVKEENEKGLIIEAAIKAIKQDRTIYIGEIYSSEGQNYGFKVRKTAVEKELKYRSDSAKIFSGIAAQAAKTNINISESTPVFIIGDAVCSQNFENQINEKYSKVELLNLKMKKNLIQHGFSLEKTNDFRIELNSGDAQDTKLKEQIKEADEYFNEKKYKIALYIYKDVLNIDPDNTHSIERINSIENILSSDDGKKSSSKSPSSSPKPGTVGRKKSAPKAPTPPPKPVTVGRKKSAPKPPTPPPKPKSTVTKKSAPKPPTPPPKPPSGMAKPEKGEGKKVVPKAPPPPPKPKSSEKGKNGPPELPKPPPLKKRGK